MLQVTGRGVNRVLASFPLRRDAEYQSRSTALSNKVTATASLTPLLPSIPIPLLPRTPHRRLQHIPTPPPCKNHKPILRSHTAPYFPRPIHDEGTD
jgi:hypothetical protein